METLRCCQIANPLKSELTRAHNLNDIKASPTYVVAQHLELNLEQ